MVRNIKFLWVGQFALLFGLIGFLMNCFLPEQNSALAFLTGICFGIATVLNLAFLCRIEKKQE